MTLKSPIKYGFKKAYQIYMALKSTIKYIFGIKKAYQLYMAVKRPIKYIWH